MPDFLVIGAQKAGTTTLHELLRRHPDVFLPACKEVHYFSLHADRPAGWYSAHFRQARGGARCGEATPYYLFHPEAPGRIRRLLPKVRLVVLLRDPVERALSQYFHARRHGFEMLGLEAALEAEAARLEGAEHELSTPGATHYSHQKHSYMSRSRYERQLEPYRTLFPAEQLLVLKSEDLFNHPERGWHQLLEFLGLGPHPLPGPLARANGGTGASSLVTPEQRFRMREDLAATHEVISQTYGISWPSP
jgi:hypothetical protein